MVIDIYFCAQRKRFIEVVPVLWPGKKEKTFTAQVPGTIISVVFVFRPGREVAQKFHFIMQQSLPPG
jgi:hypothetical protein